MRMRQASENVVIVIALTIIGTTSQSEADRAADNDIARRNSRRLLTRRLLRNYERITPPGVPITVELGVYINYIYAISEQTMDFSLSMYLRQQWYDSRLAYDPESNNNSTKLKLGDDGWKKIWVPDTFFCNEKTASFHKVTTPNRLVYVHHNGRVWYVSKITATLSCPMKLHKYPLDTQGCPITFSSFDYSLETIELKWIVPRDSAVQFDPGGEDDSQFIIKYFVLTNCTHNSTDAYPPGEVPCLEVILVVRRNLGYFLIQYYIPSVLLVILSWVSFWISVDAVVARVNLGLLTVLTLTTQSTGSRDQLPRVSYVKAIDVWMSTCLVFAFASLIEFAIVNVWSRREARRAKHAGMSTLKRALHNTLPPPAITTTVIADDTDEQIDDRPHQQQQQECMGDDKYGNSLTVPGVSDQISPALSDSSLASSSVSAPAAVNRRRSSTTSHVQHQQTSVHRRLSFQLMPIPALHGPRPVEQPSTIDKLSRVLFPCSFLAFNLAYWLIYTT